MHQALLNRAVVAVALILLSGSVAAGDAYPSGTIKLVVPFPPGGPSDLVARVLGDEIQKALHQSVIVENKTGASGTLGASSVARSSPDGYTLLLGNVSTQSVVPATMKNLPYHPEHDFVSVAQIANAPFLLIINPRVPAKSLPDLIRLMRERPSGYAHGASGVGSVIHLAGVQFEQATNTKAKVVQYRGGQPVLFDLVAGELQFAFMDVGSSAPFIKDGRVRALCVAAPHRAAGMASVPTCAEEGLKGFEVPGWIGLFAPARTPRPVIETLSKAVAAALAQGSARRRIADAGLEPVFADATALSSKVTESFKWAAELTRTANIALK